MRTPASKCKAKGGPLQCRYHSKGVMGAAAAAASALGSAIDEARASGDQGRVEQLETQLAKVQADQKAMKREVEARKLHKQLSANFAKVASEGTRPAPRTPSSVTLNGKEVKVLKSHRLPDSTRRILRHCGYSCPDMLEIDPANGGAKTFQEMMEATRVGPFASSVYVYPENETVYDNGYKEKGYADMRLFTSENGECGFALKPPNPGDDDQRWDIVSVFTMPKAQLSQVSGGRVSDSQGKYAQSMLLQAIANGGRKLDCFDTVLPQLYASVGFTEYHRDEWDEQYRPDGWDYDTYRNYNGGRPDVVYMEWNEGNLPDYFDDKTARDISDYLD